jgi:hypothetical protein
MINEKKKGASKDACYSKVKSRYSVWPSAYASGALVKCRKVGAANWGNSKKKNESIHNAYFNLAACLFENDLVPYNGGLTPQGDKREPRDVKAEVIDKPKKPKFNKPKPTSVPPKKPKSKTAVETAVEKAAKLQNKSQRGTGQTIPGRVIDRFKDRVVDFATAKGLRTGLANTRQSINRGRAAAKAGRERIQFQHTEYKRIGSVIAEKSAAWTRKEGKNPSGGLNAKGVASYRAKNPGSKLKTAVTTKPSKLKKGSKAAGRRKSFCARMSGMRKRQKASNNTGKDRLSLSLKKWNC